MAPAIYDDPELVSWYPLIDPPAEHAEEVASYLEAFAAAIDGSRATLLDLGSGGGHNAWHLKRHYACTLVDVAEPMLALSRARNPECEHVAGDMRTLRLGRTFDAVLVHDAVTYMLSEDDLRAAIATAFVHTRPGGAALFTPDDLAETFEDRAELIENADGARALKYIEWQWDPVPDDGRCRVEFMLLLREHGEVRAVHDRHEHALFPRATWIRLLTEAGYQVDPIRRPIGDGETDEVFLCRRRRRA
jgi:hypothetical protein